MSPRELNHIYDKQKISMMVELRGKRKKKKYIYIYRHTHTHTHTHTYIYIHRHTWERDQELQYSAEHANTLKSNKVTAREMKMCRCILKTLKESVHVIYFTCSV